MSKKKVSLDELSKHTGISKKKKKNKVSKDRGEELALDLERISNRKISVDPTLFGKIDPPKKRETVIPKDIISKWVVDDEKELLDKVDNYISEFRELLLEQSIRSLALRSASVDVTDALKQVLKDETVKVDASHELTTLDKLHLVERTKKIASIIGDISLADVLLPKGDPS